MSHRSSRWNGTRILLVVLVLGIAIAELIAIYGVLPGRASATFTGIQPDSVTYICQGTRFSTLSVQEAAQATGSLFQRFGYPPHACVEQASVMPWQVNARPLLPGMIAAAVDIWASSWALLIPSMLVFLGLTLLWLRIIAPADQRPGLMAWVLAIAPFAAITMILWPASVLTEGPVLVLSLLAVMILAATSMEPDAKAPGRRRMSGLAFAALIIIGLTLLLTRQSWPIVGAFWCAALIILGRARFARDPGEDSSPPMHAQVRGITIALISLILGYGVAILTALILEWWLVPAGLKEQQQYVPEGLVIGQLPAVIWASITSTTNDIIIAVSRADVVSPLLLLGGIAALVLLIRRRAWILTFVCSIAWVFGFYSVGLVQVFDNASRTHLRFLVPATLMTIAALVLARRQDHAIHASPPMATDVERNGKDSPTH